jgi:hypothetical protein
MQETTTTPLLLCAQHESVLPMLISAIFFSLLSYPLFMYAVIYVIHAFLNGLWLFRPVYEFRLLHVGFRIKNAFCTLVLQVITDIVSVFLNC